MVSYDVIMKSNVIHPRSDSRNWPRSSECAHSVSAGQEIVPNRIGKEVNIFASNWWAMMAS